MPEKIEHAAPVPPFVTFVTSTVPMVFDNSMSYYEALCALWKWLQDDVIDVINNNASVTEIWRQELTDFEEDLTDKFDDLSDEFDQLEEFVNTYFDNLDVQEEINNKLDAMVEDGTLQTLINNFLQPNVTWTFDTIADMQASTNLVNGGYAQTLGATTLGDGGGAIYKIINSGTADGDNVISVGDLFAHKVFYHYITTQSQFEAALADGNNKTSYVGGKVSIGSAITLTDAQQCAFKSFSNITFDLSVDMFTWTTMSAYHAIPNFVNCTFIGNGHNIVADGGYVLGGKFVNCNFIDCGIVEAGTMVQSMRFVNCRIANNTFHTFIEAKQVYDTQFISCQCESDNKAIIVDANTTTANEQSTSELNFTSCIFESQTTNIVKMHDGDISLNDCYTESNSENMIEVLASNRSTQPIILVNIDDCRIQPTSAKYAVNIDNSYEGSIWSSFKCTNSRINVGSLVNTNNLHYFVIENVIVTGTGQILPSVELSKIYTHKNSVADFSTTGHCIVKKFPALIVFDSSDGGWHSNLYFVSLCSNNTPQVLCLSDPSKTPTITYDSETGFCDVTLHTGRGSYMNCCAVLLNALNNNLIRNNYWTVTDGYNV